MSQVETEHKPSNNLPAKYAGLHRISPYVQYRTVRDLTDGRIVSNGVNGLYFNLSK